MRTSNLSLLLLAAAIMMASACSSPVTTPSTMEASGSATTRTTQVTFNLLRDGQPLVGWFVCYENGCARSDERGSAVVAMPSEAFITFRGPDGNYGDIYRAVAAPFTVVIR